VIYGRPQGAKQADDCRALVESGRTKFEWNDALQDAGLPTLLTRGIVLANEGMTMTKLDLTGLKCPLPELKTRKALKALAAGERLEVYCADPLSVIDIPNLNNETGDRVEITEQAEKRIVFMIEKANGAVA